MDEIDQIVEQETMLLEMRLNRVRAQVGPAGALGAEFCEDCGDEIPMARRRAVPTAVRCIDCQSKLERRG